MTDVSPQSPSHLIDGPAAVPLVSVVLPVRDGARFLNEAIASMRGQTLRALEIIILDDGSTDASAAIADRHALADSRVRVHRLGRVGIAAALNAGIELARAPWVARMDADDVSEPCRLERQMTKLDQQPSIAALGSYARIIGATGREVGAIAKGPVSLAHYKRDRADAAIGLIHSSAIFKRDVALALGGYRAEYAPAEDVDFWARMAEEHLVLALPEILVSYRVASAQVSIRQFRAQSTCADRARRNARRRLNGLPELSPEEHATLQRQAPLHVRIGWALDRESKRCYRLGGALLAEGSPAGVVWLVASALLNPRLAFDRLSRQIGLRRVSQNPSLSVIANTGGSAE